MEIFSTPAFIKVISEGWRGRFALIEGKRCQIVRTRYEVTNSSRPQDLYIGLYLPRREWADFVIYVVREPLGIFKDAVISILATIAKQERIRISERVKAGLDRARSRGKSLGRPRVVLDAERIATLRSQGLAWRGIARELQERIVENAARAERAPRWIRTLLPDTGVPRDTGPSSDDPAFRHPRVLP